METWDHGVGRSRSKEVSAFRSWLQASRPLAQVQVALPISIGAAIGALQVGSLSLLGLVHALAFGLFSHLSIVFLNDLTDEVSDASNRSPTWCSGGSRVLQEGKLRRADLRNAGRAAFSACFVVAALGGAKVLLLYAAGALLVVLYHCPPFQMSYRGYGEWLQGLGLGVVLPLSGLYLQGGRVSPGVVLFCAGSVLVGAALHIFTALPDEPADRAVQKRTFVVRRGAQAARLMIAVLSVGAIALYAVARAV